MRGLLPPREKGVEVQQPKEAEKAEGSSKGGFRETMWFMDALDPDSLSNIDDNDIRVRGEKFEDRGDEVDVDMRRQFSLNAGPVKPSLSKANLDNTLEHRSYQKKQPSGPNFPMIALFVLSLLGLAIYLFTSG